MDSIVIVVPELQPVPPVQGGAVEHWVDEASRRLLTPHQRLAIVSRPANVAGNTHIEYIGIPWTPMELFFHRLKERVTWKNPLRYIAKIQNVYSYGQRVARAVAKFDLVYLHNEPNILLLLNKRVGQKIVLHMHNEHLSMRLFRPFYRRGLAKADQIICVSDYIRQQAIAIFPEYAERFHVVFNATDTDVFKPYHNEALQQLAGLVNFDPNKRYLLYVGRLMPIKGVHVLLDAFREIHRLLPDVRLIITGASFFSAGVKTAYEQELMALADSVSEAIVFTGFLPHEKLKYLYSAVDIIVFPSTCQDACPLVVLEAMSSGTCLIASAVGGVPEILENDKNGLLVEANNPTALTRAICDTLNAPKTLQRMENAARQKIIDGYTWQRLVNELNTLFGSLT